MRMICRAFVFVAVIASGFSASAQDGEPRVAAGGFVSGLGLYEETWMPKTSTGVGAWLDWHVRGPLALEGRLSWFPTNESVEFETQGGRTLKMMAGARGTLLAARRLRLYGLLQPGVIRFSNTASNDPDGHERLGPRTHFALDIGAAIELFPQSRWNARFDFISTLSIVPGPSVGAQAVDTFEVSAGVGRRFGTRRESSPSDDAVGRWTLGPQIAYAVTATVGDVSPLHDAGVGVFVSCRVSRFVYVDGTLNTFFQKPVSRTPWDGGRVLQGLAGVKVGLQKERVGLFVKARGGINSYSEVYQARDHIARTLTVGRSNIPALDLGGIVEVDGGARFLLRFEGGDLRSFYSYRELIVDGVSVPQPSLPLKHNIQTSAGVGWRF
jgi:hypothetical protein